VVLGSIIAIFGEISPFCNCGTRVCACSASLANYTLNLMGLLVTVVFTFAFIYSLISVGRDLENIIPN
jgi:hypothetical protein